MTMEIIKQLGLMATPLIFCSVAVMAIILERIVYFALDKKRLQNNSDDLKKMLKTHKNHAKPLRDEFVSIALSQMKADYHKGVKLLRVIGTIAPLMGLLGTILGIIKAFQKIASTTTHVSPNLIADGLWEAMLTTAVGLMIAIPALLFAYFFSTIAVQRLQKLSFALNQDSLNIEIEKNR
ncbi:Ferric siderophore transport system, biopolymer transport protein ExbB [uncultured Candidatus Thioglobus sp.]|nr:Ferric siderophore transport system, biopolymer transport protein ExbB [uncultured Candidatus Thioglobus sp.]